MTDDGVTKEEIRKATVITNERITLSHVLEDCLPDTTRANIAVGFFFISGFEPIMNSLKKIEESKNENHVLRLLISPVTDKRTAEALLAGNEEYNTVQRKTRSPTQRSEDTVETVKDQVHNAMAHMPQRDQDQSVVDKFVKLMSDKKIQVKVHTSSPLHAKVYIFELEPGQHTRVISVVGSSNLSLPGIRDHAELNLKTVIPEHTEKLLEWFDKHWDDKDSVECTKDIIRIMKSSWAGGLYPPRDVYDKAVLTAHPEIKNATMPDSTKIRLYDFQKRAVVSAIHKIENYGGVMVADVVGTGKSYIGGMILKYMSEKNNLYPLVICPPHLQGMWKKYLKDFGLPPNIVSRYKIGDEDDILSQYKHCNAILVDESHNFRHTNTRSYEALSRFMEERADDAKIIMLTATPISNGINDLKNQLKLFPDSILNIPVLEKGGLDEYFKGLEKDRKMSDDAKEKIKELLRYILIRRTRTQIIERYGKQGKDERWYIEKDGEPQYFPKRDLKNPAQYDLDKVYRKGTFKHILSSIKDLELARYNPGKYLKPEYMEGGKHADEPKYKNLRNNSVSMVGIVRTMLLKRMESSIKAFSTSVQHYLDGSEEFCKQLAKYDRVPIGKDFSDLIYKKISGDMDLEELKEDSSDIKSDYDINAFDVNQWIMDLELDISKFQGMARMIPAEKKFFETDDKAIKLCEMIKGFGEEKILIFTESAVTAEYIHEHLKRHFGKKGVKNPSRKMLHIDSKNSGIEKNAAIQRFDPINNPGDIDIHPEDEINTLISTDVLSEGVNLQAGRIVINYDFHWNPVKLIQRVGRIDRIGTTHDTIMVRNFLPNTEVDDKLRLRERVAGKIEMIRGIIGMDQKILESTEMVDEKSVEAIYTGDTDILDRDEELSILDTYTDVEKDADEIVEDSVKNARVQALPSGLRGVAARGSLIIACEAIETTTDKTTGIVINSRPVRRYYKVGQKGEVRNIMPGKMLEEMREYRNMRGLADDSGYNDMVSLAWSRFKNDMKLSDAHHRKRKVQIQLIKKMEDIAREKPEFEGRALDIKAWLAKTKMMASRHPCKALISLKRDIDEQRVTEYDTILGKIEDIHTEYRNSGYKKSTGKPKILYSMMVGT